MAFGFGSSIGEAFVTIRPETKGFAGEAKRGILAPIKGIALAAGGLFAAAGVGSFLKESVSEARAANKVGKQTAAVLKSTGKAAKVSAKEISDLAGAISRKTGIDDEAIQSGENMLLTFTRVRNEVGSGNDIFNQATQTITDMSVALGQDMKGSAIQVGKALNDPIKGVTALQRVGVTFTAQQKEQIKTLVKSGDTLGAQKLILRELNTEFGGSAAASADAGDKLKVVFGNIQEDVGNLLIPAIDRAATFLSERLPGALDTVKTAFGKVGDFGATIADKFDLSGIGGKLATEAKTWAGKLIGGVRDGLKTGDFSGLGKVLGDGLARIIGTGSTLVAAFAGVDWLKLGKDVAKAAAPFIIGFGNEFTSSLLLEAKNHPLDFALFIASIIPVGRVAGLLAKVFGKLPLLGPLLKGLEGAGSLLEKPVGAIVGFVGRAFKTGFGKHFPGVVGSLKGKLLLLDTTIRSKAIDLARAGLRMIAGLITGIGSGLGRVAAAGLRVVAAALRPFAGAGGWLVSRGAQLIGGLVRGISGAVGRVTGALAGIAGRVRGAVAGAAGWLFAAGQAVVGGLISGIQSRIPSLGGVLGGIKNFIQSHKGPLDEDARLLIPAGRAVMSGLMTGIDAEMGNLGRTLQGVTGLLGGAAPVSGRRPPAGTSPITTTGSSGVTQNFTLVQQPGQSAPAFVQAAMFAARTQLRPAG